MARPLYILRKWKVIDVRRARTLLPGQIEWIEDEAVARTLIKIGVAEEAKTSRAQAQDETETREVAEEAPAESPKDEAPAESPKDEAPAESPKDEAPASKPPAWSDLEISESSLQILEEHGAHLNPLTVSRETLDDVLGSAQRAAYVVKAIEKYREENE